MRPSCWAEKASEKGEVGRRRASQKEASKEASGKSVCAPARPKEREARAHISVRQLKLARSAGSPHSPHSPHWAPPFWPKSCRKASETI